MDIFSCAYLHCCCSVTKSRPTLCNSMDWSMPGFPSLSVSWSLLRLMSTELMMLSSHLILCCSLLLLPSLFPNIRVFTNESGLHIRWPEYWSFSFSLCPFNEYSGLMSLRIDWFDLPAVQSKKLSWVFFSTTALKHQFFGTQPTLWSNS